MVMTTLATLVMAVAMVAVYLHTNRTSIVKCLWSILSSFFLPVTAAFYHITI